MTVKVKFSDKLRVSSGIKTQSTDLLKGRKYASEFQCSFGSLVFLRKAAFWNSSLRVYITTCVWT